MTQKDPKFTARQTQVMSGVGRGLSYKEIGLELNMSHHTVRTTVNTIALQIDEFPELPPRWRVWAYIKARQWTALTLSIATPTKL